MVHIYKPDRFRRNGCHISFFVLTAVIALLLFSSTVEAKNCKKGKPCGNSCIAKDKVCRIGTYSSPHTTNRTKTIPSSANTPKQSTVKAASHPSVTGTYFVVPETLNIRSTPSTEGDLLGQAKKGEMMSVFMVNGSWGKISHSNVTGWVRMDYLSMQRPDISNE
ncbi:SH3 domain-containing protein [Rheinheimera sp. NSM]|uniref:SH3 domain-containing protein n=1 Tax=Rheinheimera sp. NSM TaxID=3457884 RepID=UPI004035930A